MNDPKIKILTFDEMLRAGIMPWDNDSHDMNKLLESFSADEQRKIKRKFRKIWRKINAAKKKKYKSNIPGQEDVYHKLDDKRFGVGKKPTREQRRRRRELVREKMISSATERANALKQSGNDIIEKSSK